MQSVDLLAESYTVRYEDDGGQYDGEYDGRLAPPDEVFSVLLRAPPAWRAGVYPF